jgi:hypothetical protein
MKYILLLLMLSTQVLGASITNCRAIGSAKRGICAQTQGASGFANGSSAAWTSGANQWTSAQNWDHKANVARTWSFWVYIDKGPTDASGYCVIFENAGAGAVGAEILVEGGNVGSTRAYLRWRDPLGAGNYGRATDAGAIPFRTWTHVAFVHNGTNNGNINNITPYVGGVASLGGSVGANAQPTATPATGDFEIGVAAWAGINSTDCLVDEFSAFQVDMNSTNVGLLLSGGRPARLNDHPNFGSIEYWYRWELDLGDGTTTTVNRANPGVGDLTGTTTSLSLNAP